MGCVVPVLFISLASCYNFGRSYILISPFHKDHPNECSLERIILGTPLPELDIKSMKPGQVIGTEYDSDKKHCNKLSCSLWENKKGTGYRLENTGCAVITKRPNNCSEYTKHDNRLPWPECCYFHVCPTTRDEL